MKSMLAGIWIILVVILVEITNRGSMPDVGAAVLICISMILMFVGIIGDKKT